MEVVLVLAGCLRLAVVLILEHKILMVLALAAMVAFYQEHIQLGFLGELVGHHV
jgi:hypothetical protein